MSNKCGFTIIEVLIVVITISILTLIVYPNWRVSLVRTEVAKAISDFKNIETAIQLYSIDNKACPNSVSFLAAPMQIHDLIKLTTPIHYITLPYTPWYKKQRIVTESYGDDVYSKIVYRGNYYYSGRNNDWELSSGGPVSSAISRNSKRWYNPSNGIISDGGFWLDSKGNNSITKF